MFDKSSQKFRNPGPPSPLTEKNPLSSILRAPLAILNYILASFGPLWFCKLQVVTLFDAKTNVFTFWGQRGEISFL